MKQYEVVILDELDGSKTYVVYELNADRKRIKELARTKNLDHAKDVIYWYSKEKNPLA